MKEENKTYKKPTYKCGICGKSYDSIPGRSNCEASCLKHQAEEARKAAEAKKKAEKEARFTEASNALDTAYELVTKCIKDYGNFSYTGELKNLDMLNLDFFPSKLWHHFWF